MDDSNRSDSCVSLAPDLMTSAIAGGIFGAVCFVGYGLLFEQFVMPHLRQPGMPMLSYGQQAFMISMPLAGFLGGGIGVSLGILRRRGLLVAALITIPIPLLVAFAVAKLWEFSFHRYGADPSDWIVFIPLLVGSAICFAWNIAIAIVGCIQLFVRRDRNHPINDPIPADRT